MQDELLPPAIEPAEIVWREGVPESSRFGDVYFSRENGLEETRYVFLKHNGLPERFCKVGNGDSFVIAESGFGTGLNFLAAWQAWRDSGPAPFATLHFVSVERYPLTVADLKKSLALWPELKELAEQLLDSYPPLVRGVHRLVLDEGRVRLTLYFGDILDAWNDLTFNADAWFLDGFAPSLNPEMWLEEAIDLIRIHSKPGTTLATFTAVGRIRRALTDAGFAMSKEPGFGRKRDMLAGCLASDSNPVNDTAHGPIAVIGAGIAGCLLARTLADRGAEVILVDEAEGPGAGASGNLQGATYVKLGVEFNDQAALALSALLFAQRYYRPFFKNFWFPTGLLQLASSPEELQRQQRFLARNGYPPEILRPVDKEEAAELCGVKTQSGGLWFPGSGWLRPGALCTTLAEHPRIKRVFNFSVETLAAQDRHWIISAKNGNQIKCTVPVLCAGHQTASLIPSCHTYRFKSIRGQVSHIRKDLISLPKAVICGQKYLNPGHSGLAVTGATFDIHDENPNPTVESHEQNLSALKDMTPALFEDHEGPLAKELEGRVAFRCTTHDYQPVADKVDDTAEDKPAPGLFMLTGLGSKGLTYAPLLAEYLADRLLGHPECLPGRLAYRLRSRRLIAQK
ncbi:bifunctional tRNA (5-methylaminomethyl-2-thiouridine)(34)-methyltransferase MnmD/FAD-dependent 5-carboxymethylaminomethyl-2-thiouridine(34) oxidoreductase MnmC [Marinobacter sp. chi1]|uniref:tRNA 5-methylaminomethyl-2-thiouridine biosynthesis bifunctional protein MnmC n=1 Tax=Marinobacter suaedae TaxID=3057675 RepID=A0ABT8W1C3_9GAMM|nr:bifunctional tRNA (5-methylaminomethyl-2-thiouridine)(34)-methyltransferase MnmD/FAD-dependent 5-carboxymethylaminomethyl-2-thiouridine(34) oxidoreductase MnmC [Marinobacter sp. chi1]MDO3722052.1 bifunctional tRNA (5-methylaminomethyl-2-thiouridine)(34)-methyltransferase MnmD/FAD-dependent 5-carboxymethylaminomethyl-2-thiouridine(34) oxidoreductase MnmC [Marinobacter sp. chi1]